jgi:hypothetical protein
MAAAEGGRGKRSDRRYEVTTAARGRDVTISHHV